MNKLLLIFLFIALQLHAKITVDGYTMSFSLEGQEDKNRKRISDLTRFERVWSIGKTSLGRKKGVKWVYSENYAVVLTYSSKQEKNKETWKTDSELKVFDREGYLLSHFKSKYDTALLHKELPYFMLYNSWDKIKMSTLYSAYGKDLCGNIKFTDVKWVKDDLYKCDTLIINLRGKMIRSMANLRNQPDDRVIDFFRNSTKVHVLEEKGSWSLVENRELKKKGWTLNKNLEKGFVPYVFKESKLSGYSLGDIKLDIKHAKKSKSKGKTLLSLEEAKSLATKLSQEQWLEKQPKNKKGIKIPFPFNDLSWQYQKENGRWLLKHIPPAGSWAEISFDLDGRNPEVKLGWGDV